MIPDLMLASLPKEASPQLRNPFDALALFCHAAMIVVGFRLIGLGEDHKIGMRIRRISACASKLTNVPEAQADMNSPKALPTEWNATTSSDYAFRYAHIRSSMEYTIKISKLGSKGVINAIGHGDDKVRSFNISTKDWFSASSFPYTASASEEDENTRRQSIVNVFLSEGRLGDFWALFRISILQKITPNLQKEGQEDEQDIETVIEEDTRHRQPAGQGQRPRPTDPIRDDPLPPAALPRPFNDPLAAEPRRPRPDFDPPDFDDEYEMNRPGIRDGMLGGGRRPLNIGERDLYPQGLGPNDPLRMGGPMGGFGPGGGGMHPTFDDPLFGGNGGVGALNGRAPPGARYDPVGPWDQPPNARGGGPHFPGGGGGFGGGFGGGNPFGGFGGNDFI